VKSAARRPILGWLVALGLGAATMAAWAALPHAPEAEPLVLLILWLNLILILVPLGAEIGRRPYSLNLMHLLSMFLFLGAASLLQYTRGVLGVPGPIRNVQGQVATAALATTFWMTGYIVAYEFRRTLGSKTPRAGFLNRPLTMPRILLLSVLALAGLVFLASADLLGVTTRGAAERAMISYAETAGAGRYSNVLFILTSNLARALSPVALMAALLLMLRNPRTVTLAVLPAVLVIGAGTLLVNNPFAAARMFFTCSLIAFLAPFFLRRFRTGWLLVGSILMGLAVLPALGDTRHALDFGELRATFQIGSPLMYLAANSDVDSLGMTAICQKWVDQHGHTWGRQILGGFLFWVPRVWWPDKPFGTGAMATSGLGFEFTNLAPPITAEALVDFGLGGVLVIGFLCGWLLARLDAIYWAPGREGVAKTYRIIDATYPFWLVCVVFYTRGDLFGAMTFGVSFTAWIAVLGLGRASARRAAVQAEPVRHEPAPLLGAAADESGAPR
jgi:hypothetical protein